MNVIFQYGNEIFVWNAQKAASNIVRHGISFERACEVFADPILLMEDATVGDEVRSLAIGITQDWKLTCVVHVVRENAMVRIISAWFASSSERERYEDYP